MPAFKRSRERRPPAESLPRIELTVRPGASGQSPAGSAQLKPAGVRRTAPNLGGTAEGCLSSLSQGRGAFSFPPKRGRCWATAPGRCNPAGCRTPGALSLVLAKESVPDPERKAALGGLICRGMGLTWRFDIDTLVSRGLYETGVRSFSRGGASRRSAYRVVS